MNKNIICPFIYKFEPPEESWIFKGSQKCCAGAVTIEKVETIRRKLESRHFDGIRYSPEKVKDYVFGGTCSAMSFAFIKKYLQMLRQSPENIAENLTDLSPHFATSCDKMRHRQAAFNTIQVVKTLADPSFHKVASLAQYYRFDVGHSSGIIKVNDENYQIKLNHELSELPEGIFVVRILKPSNNDKLEVHGHTMVYIRNRDHSFYYDPNNGAVNLAGLDPAEIITQSFRFCQTKFKVTEARFYQILSQDL